MSVKLRKRKLKGGRVSLYLDVYSRGRRDYQFLGLYLEGDRLADRETLRLAEAVRAKLVLELQNVEHGFHARHKGKANFVDFFRELKEQKPSTDSAWRNTLMHLETFSGGRVQINAVDEEWLEQFKAYLLSRVSTNTARTYFAKIRAALNHAVRRRMLASNPALRVEHVPLEDKERVYLTLEEVQMLADTPCRNEVNRPGYSGDWFS